MIRKRNLVCLFVTVIALAGSLIAQNTPKPSTSSPTETAWDRTYIQSSYERGRDRGDIADDTDEKTVSSFPVKGYSFAAGYRFGSGWKRHLSLEARFAKKTAQGNTQLRLSNVLSSDDLAGLEELGVDPSLFAQQLNPVERLKLSTKSLEGGASWHFFPGRRFDLALGGGVMAMRISHLMTGNVPAGFDFNTLQLTTQPLLDRGSETHPEVALRPSFSFPLFYRLRGVVEYENVINMSQHVNVTLQIPLSTFGLGRKPKSQ